MPVFRSNSRAAWRRRPHATTGDCESVGALRENYRLVLLVVVVAAVVSAGVNATWMALDKVFETAAATTQQTVPPPN